ALTVSGGGVVDTLSLIGVAPGTAFALSDDGRGGTEVHEVPPAPSGLVLLSDSGTPGDNRTNVTVPLIGGSGEAGDRVRLFDGGADTGQSTIVGAGGGWVLAPSLAAGVHLLTASESDGAGEVSLPSAGLSVTIDTSAPLTAVVSASFAFDGGAAPIGIASPSDSDDPADALGVTVTGLPGNGTLTLGDGVTPVTAGEPLTIGQLSGLLFTPAADRPAAGGSFGYSVTDRAGNTAAGGATLTVVPSATVSFFDFLFAYGDGKDYYYGRAADNGTFGYHVGQHISVGLGQYTVFDKEGLPAPVAAGSVFVSNYSHDGPGAASPVPLGFPAADGIGGLGSESDAVRGSDGQPHNFSPTLEASFATSALFGFVFSYADGAAFYTGTVAVAPGSTPAVPSGGILGSYSVFAEGVTPRDAGTVAVDRFTAGGASYVPDGAAGGAGGLGSEAGSITVNGTTFVFSDRQEPVIPSGIASVPLDPTPDPNDVVASILTEIYREVLDRLPDPGGLATYRAGLAGGGSAASVRRDIAASDEAGGLINGLYHQIFGRDADPVGLAIYRGALANGSSL
ncbi:MAG TPA: Ig-like domain-containing protein, partial [Actinomycetota bacterium]|nr:Ig-like domain-containing protein [Actinomycetota bacterium]